MNSKILLSFFLGLTLFLTPSIQIVEGQETLPEFEEVPIMSEEFYTGKVIRVSSIPEGAGDMLELEVRLDRGEENGTTVTLEYQPQGVDSVSNIETGQRVIVSKIAQDDVYSFVDLYRFPSVIWLFVIFFVIVIAVAGWQGVRSIVSLSLSILILIGFILRTIAQGSPALITGLIGIIVIACVTLYLSHRFNKRTTIALISTIITILIATLLALFFAWLTHLTGTGTEEAVFLQLDPVNSINLLDLLLAGIIIGTLGVLDDITTAQAATVDELIKANPNLSRRELYKRGMSVGKEHIASLVNTLFLAYAGVSLPLLFLFFTNNATPFWVALSSEFLTEEIVRTLVGSIALVSAVPITTILAAKFLVKKA